MPNDMLIGALRAEATLESGKFVQGAQKLRTEAKKTETALKGSFGAMGAAVKGFAGAMTAGLSIGLLGGLAKRALDFAKNIGVVAKQLNVTTKELQTFRFAAEQVGVKNVEADKALEKLGVTLGKAEAGSRSATKALASVGVSLNDIQTKSRTEIFGQIADQMIRQGGAARNAAAANAIFGESASKLTPLLDQGSRGINELSLAAERLGVVLSDSQIQQADETARKLEAVKTVLEAQIAGVVSDNAESIVTLANALATLTSAIVNFLGSNPTAALAILGALAGSRFGPVGAAAGGFAGAVFGSGIAGQRGPAAHTKDDVPFLRHNLKVFREELLAKRAGGGAITVGEVAQLNRMTAKLRGAAGLANPISSAAIPQFLAPSSGGGRRGRTPRGPRDRSDDVAFQFASEMRRAEMDTLRALQSLSHDYVERAAISVQLLDLQRQEQQAELDNRVRRAERDFAEGKIDAQTLEQVKIQAAQLSAEYDKQLTLEKQAVAEQVELDRQQDFNRLEAVDFDIQRQMLEGEAALAETAAERRKVELRILDLAYREEKERLERIVRESKDWAEIEEARRRLAALPGQQAQARAGAMAGTRGPLESYYASLPMTADKMNAALQDVAVNGLQSLEDGLMSVIDGTESVGEAFRKMAQSILSDLIRLSIQRMIIGPLTQSLFPAFGLPSPGAVPTVPGMAMGGSFMVGGVPGVDRNLLSINGLPVARVSYNERINVTNDNAAPGPSRSITVHAPITIHGNASRATLDQAADKIRRRVASVAQKGY